MFTIAHLSDPHLAPLPQPRGQRVVQAQLRFQFGHAVQLRRPWAAAVEPRRNAVVGELGPVEHGGAIDLR